MQRAEKAGFEALVVTVDQAAFGMRWNETRNSFAVPKPLTLANLTLNDPGLAASMNWSDDGDNKVKELHNNFANYFDYGITWEVIEYLRSVSSLPIIIKGILSPKDAVLAAKAGAAGIIVSNHGGRQLNGAIASIDALAAIKAAVGNTCDVYLDSGVREGIDVFRALALGAKMVFVGRPVFYGLAAGGQAGVEKVLDMLAEEFKNTMALAGCRSVDEIQADHVIRRKLMSHL